MLVVFDTNILVSALLSPSGKPAQIFRRFLSGELQLCVDERILAEYETVLHRPKFRFEPNQVDVILQFIRAHSLNIAPPVSDIPFADPADKKFYEVAKHCHALLITGNIKHFPNESFIKTVQELF